MLRLKRSFIGFLVCAVLLAGVVGCAGTATPGAGVETSKQGATDQVAGKEASKEVIRWKAITYLADNSPYTQANKVWAREVEKRTNGRLVVDWYAGGTVVGSNEELNAIEKGIADVALIYYGYYPGELQVATINGIPSLAPESLEQQALIMDEVAKTPQFAAEFARHNAVYLMFSASPTYSLMGNKPIRKIEDFKGIKVRAVSGQADLVKRLGGTPVSIPSTEAFTALNNGLVDLVAGAGDVSHLSNKYNEISKYYMPGIPLGGAGNIAIVNKNTWEKLPQDIKDVFGQLRVEQGKVSQRVLADPEEGKKLRDDFKSRGIEIIPFPKEEQDKVLAVAKPMWDEWVAAGKDRGAKEVLDVYLAAKKKFEGK